MPLPWSSHLRGRVLVVVVTALLVGLVVPPRAHACSCGGPGLVEFGDDADQALVLAQRLDLDGGPQGDLRVLRTLLGSAVIGPVDATFDNGASCDPWLRGGGIAGLVLAREDGRWTTTTCGQLPAADALQQGGVEAHSDPRAGPATLLVAGDLAGARLATVDRAGRTVATAGNDGVTVALGRCPGNETVVEVMRQDDQVEVQRWRLPALEAIGRPVPIPARSGWSAAARCDHPDGRRAIVIVPAYGEPGTITVLDGDQVVHEQASIEWAAAGGDTLAVVIRPGRGDTSPDTIGLVGADGEVEVRHRAPGVAYDRLSVSPDGTHVLAAGYPPEADGTEVVTRIGMADDQVVTRRVPGYHGIGWAGPDQPWLQDLEGDQGAAPTTVAVAGLDLTNPETVDVGVGAPTFLDDGGVLRLGIDVLPSVVRDSRVTAAADLALVGATEAIVLDPDGVLTAGPESKTPTPSDAVPPTPTPEVAAGGPTSTWLVVAGLALVVVAVMAAVRRRGRQP